MTSQKPLVSVMIASVNAMPSLGECLEHLVRQEGGHPYEVFVADRRGEGLRQELKRRSPQPEIRVIAAPEGPSIPKHARWAWPRHARRRSPFSRTTATSTRAVSTPSRDLWSRGVWRWAH